MPCDWREAGDRLAGLLASRLRELFALALCAFWLGSAAAAVPTALPLGDAQSAFNALEIGQVWVDPAGTVTLEQVLLHGKALFLPNRADNIYALGEHGTLWYHLRLVRGRSERHGWVLAFPMPALDAVTVYQQDAGGRWLAETAGDTVAVAAWPEPGRYPHFRLDLPPGQPRDVYVRIRHLTSANFPVQLMSEVAYDQRIQIEYLALGLTFGALMLLIAVCLAQSVIYRDAAYAWYAMYALTTMLGVGAYTGVAAHLLWPGFGALRDAPPAALAILAVAAALLFVRGLTGISARHAVMDRVVYATGLAGIGMAALYPFLDKPVALAMLAAYILASSAMSVAIAVAGWRRGDVVGAWVLAASLPYALTLTMPLARLFGLLPVSFATQYAIVVAMAVQVPLLLVALNIRSRERHGAEIREQALSSQDALTGLLAPHLFHDRLRQVVARYKRDKENSALVFIDLVNYPRIKDYYGSAVAEQSLLRSVIKLRRLLRDVDTVSRIGEARFGLILEGVSSRIAVTDRAARLIAAGLMPLQGLKPDVTLQFHIAAVLLEERAAEAPELVEALDGLLRGMSPRTRRPIRFLEPQNTEPAPLSSDSSLLESDSVPPRAGPVGLVSPSPFTRSANRQ
ncbi:7TM diverse intracellular signaling domain-containing protein [Ramlibacter sp. WS9]|uniref:sensor domain-containing diguanylate cyclase n=1 Tax=Ramlibacter sp. WS9 TaxID=1882741 RepID=UPI00130528E2|nr:7TM diverse intracellular signaling domain-containing protein [Ramlibacter sp. WS9]